METARWKVFRPLIAVAAVGIVPGLLLFSLQWYFLNRFESVTALVLRQASQNVAAAFAQQITQEFKAPTPNLLEQVPHDAVRRQQWSRIAPILDAKKREFRIVDRFFMWSRP